MFSPIPDARNSPPRILLNTVTPQQVTNFGGSCTPSFGFAVEDPDVADVIRHRWFVYKPGENRAVFFQDKNLPGGTTAVRQQKITAPTQLFTISELVQNGEHMLEVVISDGEFATAAEPQPRTRFLPDGGSVEDPTYIDTYVWLVKTSDTAPACP